MDLQLPKQPISPPMVAGAASGVHEQAAASIKAAATKAVGIPPEQIEAYAKAHREFESAFNVAWLTDDQGTGLLSNVVFQRRAPEPPGIVLTARNGVESTWCIYSAAYDQPRFRLAIPPGVLQADRYLVIADGHKIGYMMAVQVIDDMKAWLSANVEPVPVVSSDLSGSAIHTID